MKKDDAQNPRKRTPLTAEEVREIGRQLAYFANQYDQAAGEMEKSSIRVIALKGAANLALTVGRINGGLQSLQSALAEVRVEPLRKSGDSARLHRLESQNEATQAKHDKSAKRRKGSD